MANAVGARRFAAKRMAKRRQCIGRGEESAVHGSNGPNTHAHATTVHTTLDACNQAIAHGTMHSPRWQAREAIFDYSQTMGAHRSRVAGRGTQAVLILTDLDPQAVLILTDPQAILILTNPDPQAILIRTALTS